MFILGYHTPLFDGGPMLGMISVDTWWASLAWNLWEALTCTGLYVMHLPILIMVQMAMEHTALGPLTLTVVAGTLTLAPCYAIHAGYEMVSSKINDYHVEFPLGRRMVSGDIDRRRNRPGVAVAATPTAPFRS